MWVLQSTEHSYQRNTTLGHVSSPVHGTQQSDMWVPLSSVGNNMTCEFYCQRNTPVNGTLLSKEHNNGTSKFYCQRNTPVKGTQQWDMWVLLSTEHSWQRNTTMGHVSSSVHGSQQWDTWVLLSTENINRTFEFACLLKTTMRRVISSWRYVYMCIYVIHVYVYMCVCM